MDDASPAPIPARFADWFASRGWSARSHQLAMVEKARAGRNALLIAPTGAGKTLAGFLPSLIELSERPPANTPRGVHTLYLSPLKALAVDIERNLMAPISEMGLNIVAESRTGDTGEARKARQRLHPPDILLTTPEQLALFCAWEGARTYFEDLSCVIIDEVHSLWPSKRGDLLSLGLARLQTFAPRMRRVGLSATVDDPDLIRRWLGTDHLSSGSNPADVPKPSSSHAARGPLLLPQGEGISADVDLVLGPPGPTPVVEMLIAEGGAPWSGHTAQHAMAEVYETIARHRTTLVFVNTRFQAEFAFQELWKLNERSLPIALHHGSLAAEQRRKVEAAMARGELRAVVCTSTLDLGIDWGDVDLVIQLAAPKGASRMVQRIGRANHRLDEPSKAIFVPANRFEVLECQAACEAIVEGALDGEAAHPGALDVLAQHVMGCACSEPFDLVSLYEEIRTSAPYAGLSWEDYEQVVDFVSTGGYALKVYDRYRRIVKGADGLWRARNAETVRRHRMNVGAIISAATLNVRVAPRKGPVGRGPPGRKIGEVEEGYLELLEPGDTFIFAGQVWKLVGLQGTDVLVSPAPHDKPKLPSWGGSKFAISTFLAAKVRRMMSDETAWPALPGDVREWLEAQRDRSVIAGPGEMLLETFPHRGRYFLTCYPFEGRLAHTTLAMLLTRRLDRAGVGPMGFTVSDYAISIWALRPMDGLDFGRLFEEDMLGDDLENWLDESFMLKRSFKGCALISGLIERRMPGAEKSGRQVTFSTDLIYDVLRRHQPDHLLLRCARADAATGMIDVARVAELLVRVKNHIRHASLERVSPFAVPILLELGRTPVAGEAAEMILADAADALIAQEADLIAEAMA